MIKSNFLASWIYMLMVAMDANFRLRSKLRAALAKDPTLGSGLSYCVDYLPYSDFIKNYVDQDEVILQVVPMWLSPNPTSTDTDLCWIPSIT
jgi:hypothetical protein